MVWIFKTYIDIAKRKSDSIIKEHKFYDDLRHQIKNVRYERKRVQEILGQETHVLEKKPYFIRAKKLALNILGHCEHGAYLAVDGEVREFYEKQKPGTHKEQVQGYIDECRGLNDALILKFSQVDKGIRHLESLLR